MKHKKGFTLIETIIYIALLGVIMSGALVTSYQLIESSSSAETKTTIQGEINFVLRKIDWALTGLQTITTPVAGYSDTLAVTKYDGTNIAIRLASGKIEISESGVGGTYLPLTTDNVTVCILQFLYIPPSSAGPAGITASTTINGFVASTTKYLRK